MPLLRPLTTSRFGLLLRHTVSRARGRTRTRSRGAEADAIEFFVSEFPWERRSIHTFVARMAHHLPAGTDLLDAGAGESPYRALFAHCRYVTADWPQSVHKGGQAADISASLEELPVPSGSFDAVLCTQVLEHVGEPLAVLRELHRILRPSGELWLTVPLVWPLHEEPYDFFRYTSYGLRHLLLQAGFDPVEVEPRNGAFATLAQLLATAEQFVGDGTDGMTKQRRRLFADMRRLAPQLAAFDHLDRLRILPLGYSVRAIAERS